LAEYGASIPAVHHGPGRRLLDLNQREEPQDLVFQAVFDAGLASIIFHYDGRQFSSSVVEMEETTARRLDVLLTYC
jgi:hypothetical protein